MIGKKLGVFGMTSEVRQQHLESIRNTKVSGLKPKDCLHKKFKTVRKEENYKIFACRECGERRYEK